MEDARRNVLNIEDISKELGIEKEKIEKFLNYLDTEFSLLTQNIFDENIINNIYKRE
jgi:predicted AAA+ superfamily ATPase